MKTKYCEKHKTFSKKCRYCTFEEKRKNLENPFEFINCPQCQLDHISMKNECSLCRNKLR